MRIVLLLAFAVASSMAKDPKPAKKVLKPLVFDASGGPWKGETPFKGASWTELRPGPDGKTLMLQASAGLNDRFPIQEAGGNILFEVTLENGTDEHIAVVVHGSEGDQRVRIPKEKTVAVKVGTETYQFTFPRTRVEADPAEHPTTNKAMVIITRASK